MTISEWKDKARELFFEKGYSIRKISEEINISRRSISKHLNSLQGYKEEHNNRKALNKEKRKEYKNNWDKKNRPNRYTTITADTMKKEHEKAVSILSHEKY
ncbi:MAG: hypothetical protein ACRCW1_06165 [Anaerotignaceae bacterium]